jgi:two-component system cell cycle response regulator DivK
MNTCHLLVVDDNPANRMLPGLLLRQDGCRVSTCDSGEDALERLQHDTCTHLLLDISLPRISGLDVCRQVRRLPQGPSIRIIAYTAHAMPPEIQEFHEAGFDGVLVKPIRRQDLIDALAIITTPDPT